MSFYKMKVKAKKLIKKMLEEGKSLKLINYTIGMEYGFSRKLVDETIEEINEIAKLQELKK